MTWKKVNGNFNNKIDEQLRILKNKCNFVIETLTK